MEAHEHIVFALDVSDADKADRLAALVGPHVGCIKVGYERVLAMFADLVGPKEKEEDALKRLKQHRAFMANLNGKAFLDLKIHDIPATVERAVRNATRLGARMVNVHCAGGALMMQKAKKAAIEAAEELEIDPPLVLGVTLLTSLDYSDLVDVGFADVVNIENAKERARIEAERTEAIAVRKLALLAQDAGLDGVICSPRELPGVRKYCQPEFKAVTPGIRKPGARPDDQKRTLAPDEAIKAGADMLVIGRPIRDAKDPVAAAKSFVDEIIMAKATMDGARIERIQNL